MGTSKTVLTDEQIADLRGYVLESGALNAEESFNLLDSHEALKAEREILARENMQLMADAATTQEFAFKADEERSILRARLALADKLARADMAEKAIRASGNHSRLADAVTEHDTALNAYTAGEKE